MKSDKLLLVMVLAVVLIVAFDMYIKYADEKRNDELKSQQLASQTLLQQQQYQGAEQQGLIGGLLGSLPIIGGLF